MKEVFDAIRSRFNADSRLRASCRLIYDGDKAEAGSRALPCVFAYVDESVPFDTFESRGQMLSLRFELFSNSTRSDQITDMIENFSRAFDYADLASSDGCWLTVSMRRGEQIGPSIVDGAWRATLNYELHGQMAARRRIRVPRKSLIWTELPGPTDNGDNEEAYFMTSEASAAQWPTLLDYSFGYIIRATALRNGMYDEDVPDADALLAGCLEMMQSRGMKIVIAANSAGKAQCNDRDDGDSSGDRSQLLAREMEQFERVRNLGGDIYAFQLQSIVSGHTNTGTCDTMYPRNPMINGAADLVIEDVNRFIDAVDAAGWSDSKIIIGDTTPAKQDDEHHEHWDYPTSYDLLIENCRRIDEFWIAWAIEETEQDGSDVVAFRDYCVSRRKPFGIKFQTDAADISQHDWGVGVMRWMHLFRSLEVYPDALLFQAFHYPRDDSTYTWNLLPETETDSFTEVGRRVCRTGQVQRRVA